MAAADAEGASHGRAGRRVWWWLGAAIALLGAYAGAGFALLPWLVKAKLPEISEREWRHRVSVGAVRFNPFSLVFEADTLRLDEPGGTRMIGVGGLVLDLEWSSLTRRAWHVARLSIAEPAVNLAIRDDGRFNLAELIAAFDSGKPREKQPLPRLLVDRFELKSGQVDFNDRRAGYTNRLAPIEFSLDDFSTLPDRNGPYTLSANTARGGSLRWSGEASVNPIAGRGQLVLDAISLPELTSYLKPFADVAIESGKFAATLPYRFAYAEGTPSFELLQASAGVADLAVRLPGAAAPTLRLAAVKIGQAGASLVKRELTLGAITLAGVEARLGKAAPALSLPAVALGDITARLEGGELAIASLKVAGGRLEVKRDARGAIDVLGFLPPAHAAPKGAAAPAAAAPALSLPWKVALKQFALDDFAVAYADAGASRPMQAAVAKLGVKFGLEASSAGASALVKLRDGEVALKDLSVGAPGDPAIRLADLGLAGASFDSGRSEVALERVWLKGGQLKLMRDAAGRINLLDLLPSSAAPAAAPAAPAAVKKGDGFKAMVKLVEAGAIVADIEDAGSGIKLRVQDAQARLTGVSSNPDAALAFDAGFKLREGGSFRGRGRFTPATAALDATLAVEALALAPLQPLIDRYIRLKLVSGQVAAEGRLVLGGKGAQVRYNGSLGLADLLLNEAGGKQFAALKAASAENIALTLGPDALEVPELRLEAPQAQLLIEADRSLNAARLLVQAPAIAAAATAPPSAAATAPAPAPSPAPPAGSGAANAPGSDITAEPFPVSVRRLRINNAKLDFEDLSLRPQFGAKIHELTGVITGLSTSPSTRSKLELDGRVDEFGLARIRGDLNPFFPRTSTDVNLVFRNVDMTTATPYAMKFAGYKIAAGRISLDLGYKVRNSRIEGDNQVVIDQLTLGERVDSPDAIKLPLELALAILKDSDGRIDLALPVSGSLDDPQFSYGAIIWKAVINVFTKIVTAPFRALGSLFGGDGAKLESVDFDPGSARLTPPEREKLRQVVQVLAKRPQLALAVPGQFNEAADAPVLRERAMRIEILRRAGLKIAEGEEPGPLDTADRNQRAALRDTLTARQGAAAFDKLLAGHETAIAAAPPGAAKPAEAPIWRRALNVVQGEPNVRDPAAFYGMLAERLATSQPLPADALARLAQARAEAIVEALKGAGVDGARIARPPVEKVEAAAKVVPLKLGLAAR